MPWYVLQVHTSHEDRVANRLDAQGAKSYWPSRSVEIRHAGKKEIVRRALFPGYVFARFKSTPLIIANPHVIRILQTDGEPAIIPDQTIESVRIMERSPSVESSTGITAEQLAAGTNVHIRCGPMAGVFGTVVRIGKHNRIVVSVAGIGKAISAEVDVDWLELQKAA